jgi:plastocyanin
MRALQSIVVVAFALSISAPVGAGGSDTIEGVVKLDGTAPARAVIDMSSDPSCSKTKIKDETVIVGKGGGLADVHVRIKSGEVGAHKAPATPVVIDQVGCMYRPRVSGAMEGQQVQIVNADPTMHNVHAYKGEKQRTAFNRAQPANAKPIMEKRLGKPGTTFTLKCDVHKWMAAFVPITDHPFFDVTSDSGAFSIAGVPTGKSYTLEAWHPKYGLKTQTVKPGDKSVSIQFP